MTGFAQSLITVILFFVILGGLVLIHELGHFITARLAKVRVLEFGIGFPPRARVIGRGGETLYTLNWLPIGGFVKLEGEDGDEDDDPHSFVRARLPVKLIILLAGVTMNLLLSFVIFTGIALTGEPAIGVTIGEVVADSPAQGIGLQPGDTLVSVNGKQYSAFGNRAPSEDLRALGGQTVSIGIVHPDGTSETRQVTLRVPATPQEGALGIGKLKGMQIGTIHLAPLDAVRLGATRTTDAFGLILGGLGDLGRSIVTSPTTAPPASGPVGIAVQLGDILWGLGPLYVLFMAGLLSANLALVNVLPFPPLDGGRMLVLVLKALPYGERISVRAERLTYAIGFVALFGFLIWITVFDIVRQVGGVTP
jgi:regulator of sigma E protease